MNNNKYIDRITIQSPKEDRDFEEYNVFSPKDLDESLTFSNEWSSEKGIHFIIRNGKLVGITKNGNPVMAQNGVIYTESTEPFSFTIGGNTYNVESGPQWTDLELTTTLPSDPGISRLFYGQQGIKVVKLCFDLSSLQNINEIFCGCTNLEEVDFSTLDTSNIKHFNGLFRECTSLSKIRGIEDLNTKNLINLFRTFDGVSQITSINLEKWDTSKVTDLTSTFSNCTNLREVNISTWDTHNVTSMQSTFEGDVNIEKLDLSKWDVSSVKRFLSMFARCNNLKEVSVESWNTESAFSMGSMFTGCTSLVVLDVSNWNTSACTNFDNTFTSCGSIKTLDVSKWNVENVLNFQSTFRDVSSVSVLDLSLWRNEVATTYKNMFNGVTEVKILDMSGMNPQNITRVDYMFYRCNSLTTLKWPLMGMIKADNSLNNVLSLSESPLGTEGDESRQALIDMFSYDRISNGLTDVLTVKLSTATKNILTEQEIAEFTSKGYTIA